MAARPVPLARPSPIHAITTIITITVPTAPTIVLSHNFPLPWILWRALFELLRLLELGLAHSQLRVVDEELPPLGIARGSI
jgi:hypothetical protein